MPSSHEPVFMPAPALPPGPRSALVIATSRYDDAQLRELRSPVKDAEDLVAVLGDEDIGGFAVTTLTDKTDSEIRFGVTEFLDGRTRDETVLVYLSRHGIRYRQRLYFASANTVMRYPQASAVQAAYILDELDRCKARRQILVLDCCFSGGFAGEKGGGDLDLESELGLESRGLASAGGGGIHVWELASGEAVDVPHFHGDARAVAFSADSGLLVSGGKGGPMQVWGVTPARHIVTRDAHVGPIHSAAFSPAGQLLASAGDDGTIRLWR